MKGTMFIIRPEDTDHTRVEKPRLDSAAHSDASGRSFRQHPVSHSGVSGHLRIVAA
jgi:hypothetical protein